MNAIRLELNIQQRSRQPEPLADVVDAVAHILQRDAMFTANGRQNMQLTQVREREKAIARVCRADHRLESSVAFAGVTVALTEAPSVHRRCRQAKDACGFAGRVGWSVDVCDSRVFVFCHGGVCALYAARLRRRPLDQVSAMETDRLWSHMQREVIVVPEIR